MDLQARQRIDLLQLGEELLRFVTKFARFPGDVDLGALRPDVGNLVLGAVLALAVWLDLRMGQGR